MHCKIYMYIFPTEEKNSCYSPNSVCCCAGNRTLALENKRKGATSYGENQDRLQNRDDLKR